MTKKQGTHHIGMTTDFIETDQPTTILISGSPGRTREIFSGKIKNDKK